MDKKELIGIISRYFILLLLGVFISLFYVIFTPLTVYSSYFILSKIMDDVRLVPEVISFFNPATVIFFKGYFARIIPACVAGSAYYLLTILNLGTPMPKSKRLKSLLFVMLAFLILNVARISIFAFLVPKGYQYFDFAHELVWYLGSTLMVALIWFANVFIFGLDKVPFYSDLKKIYLEAISKGEVK